MNLSFAGTFAVEVIASYTTVLIASRISGEVDASMSIRTSGMFVLLKISVYARNCRYIPTLWSGQEQDWNRPCFASGATRKMDCFIAIALRNDEDRQRHCLKRPARRQSFGGFSFRKRSRSSCTEYGIGMGSPT